MARAFRLPVRLAWAAIVLLTVLSETLPAPRTTLVRFYAYVAVKAVAFVMIGYLSPLSFWQFGALNRGVLFAVLSAGTVEALQAVIGNGHRFRWYELIVKLVLLLLGFIIALDARYEGAARIGFLVILFEQPSQSRATSVPEKDAAKKAI